MEENCSEMQLHCDFMLRTQRVYVHGVFLQSDALFERGTALRIDDSNTNTNTVVLVFLSKKKKIEE